MSRERDSESHNKSQAYLNQVIQDKQYKLRMTQLTPCIQQRTSHQSCDVNHDHTYNIDTDMLFVFEFISAAPVVWVNC
jgi:hypothetical protein